MSPSPQVSPVSTQNMVCLPHVAPTRYPQLAYPST